MMIKTLKINIFHKDTTLFPENYLCIIYYKGHCEQYELSADIHNPLQYFISMCRRSKSANDDERTRSMFLTPHTKSS